MQEKKKQRWEENREKIEALTELVGKLVNAHNTMVTQMSQSNRAVLGRRPTLVTNEAKALKQMLHDLEEG